MHYKYSKYKRHTDSGFDDRYAELRTGVSDFEITKTFKFSVKNDDVRRSARDARVRRAATDNVDRYTIRRKPEKRPPISLAMFMKRNEDPEEESQIKIPVLDQPWDSDYCKPISEIFIFKKPIQENRIPNVILPPEERKKFDKNKLLLDAFIKKHNCEKVPKMNRRINKLADWKSKRPNRVAAKDVSDTDRDPFGYEVYYPIDLQKSTGEEMRRRRHEIFKRMAEFRYDFDYENRPSYKERQLKRDEYLASKNIGQKNSEKVKEAKEPDIPSFIKPPEALKKPRTSLPVPALPSRQKSQETPKEVAKDKEPSRTPVIKMIDIFDVPSTSAARVEKRKDSKNRSVDGEPAKKKREIATKEVSKKTESSTTTPIEQPAPIIQKDTPSPSIDFVDITCDDKQKEDEEERRKAEEEIENTRKALEESEERRKKAEELERIRREQEELYRKNREEEMLRKKEEEEKARKEKDEIARMKMEEERQKKEKEELERKKKEEEERIRDQKKMEEDMLELATLEKIRAARARNLRKTQKAQEQREVLFHNRLKKEIVDNDYEKAAKISPAEPRKSSDHQQDEYFEDEYMDIESEDDDIQIISESIIPYVDNSAIPEKKTLMTYRLVEIETFRPKESQKVKSFKSVGLDYVKMRKDRTAKEKTEPNKIKVCTDEGLAEDAAVRTTYELLTRELRQYLGAEMDVVKFPLVDNQIAGGVAGRISHSSEGVNRSSSDTGSGPQSRSGSEERELEAKRTDYTKIDVEQLKSTWQWPFDEAAGVYWPVTIDEGIQSGSADIDHVRQMLACHSYSGTFASIMMLTSLQSPKDSIDEFNANYNRSGDDENSEFEWRKYKSKPGRFSKRIGYKTNYIEQDREEASRIDQDNRNKEMEMDNEYDARINKFRAENNVEKANESSREMLGSHIRSNRIDMYSKVEDNAQLRNFHPGRRRNPVEIQKWTRSGYRFLVSEQRDIALGMEMNRMTAEYDNLVPSEFAEYENWCCFPMLASIYYQIAYQPFDVYKTTNTAVLKMRRHEYDKLIEKPNFSLKSVVELSRLMPTDTASWTIIYDQLSTLFKFLPPLAELMKHPNMIEVVNRAFEHAISTPPDSLAIL